MSFYEKTVAERQRWYDQALLRFYFLVGMTGGAPIERSNDIVDELTDILFSAMPDKHEYVKLDERGWHITTLGRERLEFLFKNPETLVPPTKGDTQ